MLTFSLNKSDNEARRVVATLDFRLNSEKACEWASTIFENALNGRVTSDTDVLAYASGCERNQKMSKAKKEVNVLSVEELNETSQVGVADTVFQYTHDYLESIIESDEINHAVAEFIDMRDYLYIEEGLDIWVLLQKLYDNLSAKRDLPKTLVEKFQYIMTEYHMEDILLVLSNHRECRNILEGVLC